MDLYSFFKTLNSVFLLLIHEFHIFAFSATKVQCRAESAK